MYSVSTGIVQAYLRHRDLSVCRHFGRVQYDSRKPIIPHYNLERIDSILEELNEGIITEDKAIEYLDRL